MKTDITKNDWYISKARVTADIIHISKDGNDGGIVCSMRADDFGKFPIANLIIYSPRMRDLLVKVLNENKCGNLLMNEISELINDLNGEPPTWETLKNKKLKQ